MNNIRIKLEQNPLISFFFMAFIISWLLWIPLMYGHFVLGWTSWEGNSWNNYKTMLGLLGSLGPAISALIMTYVLKGKTEVKLLLKRVLQWKVNIVWWLIGLYSWWLLCSLLSLVLNISDINKITFTFLISLINIPAMIFVLQLPLLVGMFGEEVGWRGFALPELLDRFNPVAASLILALPWIFWHTPLAVFQEWRGNTSLLDFFLNYFLLIVPLTLIFTWFFQKTKGSLLLIILLHKSFNLTFNAYRIALGMSERSGEVLREWSIAALWLVAGVITLYYLKSSKKVKSHTP
jgi:membrane protease YdiL (CAAX protease family)